jgi:hypothetical protein
MSIRTRAVLAIFPLVVFAFSLARADTKSDAAFEHKPKSPNEKVTLQLDDTELSEVARVIGELMGKQFVVAS